jgi:hypothetical protein
VIGEYERAFYGAQYASMAPLFEHYGIQLWTPEAGGRIDFHAEDHEETMLALGVQSKREIARTRIRVRTAMATQTREQGRYLGGRPPYGYRLADAGPHPNKAKAADGKRLYVLARDEPAAIVVVRIFAEFLAGFGIFAISERLTREASPARPLTIGPATGTAAAWPGPRAPSVPSWPTPATPAARSGTASTRTRSCSTCTTSRSATPP